MSKRNNKHIHRNLLAGAAILLFSHMAAAIPMTYTLTALGDLNGGAFLSQANDINNAGQVVGYSLSSPHFEAFIWDETNGMQGLGTIPPSTYPYENSFGYALNINGVVTGDARSSKISHQAFTGDLVSGIEGIGFLPGGHVSHAYGINDINQVVGRSIFSSGGRSNEAFVWDSVDGMTGLGHLPGGGRSFSEARDINNRGQVVGFDLLFSHDYEAFLWDETNGMVGLGRLPTLSNSQAYSLNESGHVVGASWNFENNKEAFFWDSNNMIGLGHLPGCSSSSALDVNSSDYAVGWCQTQNVDEAFLWTSADGMLRLSDLADNSANGWILQQATAINDSGYIVGFGINPGGFREAYLLKPQKSVPEPSAIALIAVGLVTLGLIPVSNRDRWEPRGVVSLPRCARQTHAGGSGWLPPRSDGVARTRGSRPSSQAPPEQVSGARPFQGIDQDQDLGGRHEV